MLWRRGLSMQVEGDCRAMYVMPPGSAKIFQPTDSDETSLPARSSEHQDDSHNDWTYITGSAQ